MATYLILDIFFLAAAGLTMRGWRRLPGRRILGVLGVMLLLTAVFDSILIQLHMFSYPSSLILGLHVGKVPIEDFAYALLAAVLVPALWEGGKK